MNLSKEIANMIIEMLETDGTSAEIRRNDLAERVGCVPSQINYVISSRFTPERGYIVESQRGGGGYIRITRAQYDLSTLKMHLINSIGESVDGKTCNKSSRQRAFNRRTGKAYHDSCIGQYLQGIARGKQKQIQSVNVQTDASEHNEIKRRDNYVVSEL